MYDWSYLVNPQFFPVRTGIADILFRAVRENVAFFWGDVSETKTAVEANVLRVLQAVYGTYEVHPARCAHWVGPQGFGP